MKITVKDLKDLAKAAGAELETDMSLTKRSPVGFDVYLNAPPGERWHSSGYPSTCWILGHSQTEPMTQDGMAQAKADIEAVIAEGAYDCDEEDCDWCEEENANEDL